MIEQTAGEIQAALSPPSRRVKAALTTDFGRVKHHVLVATTVSALLVLLLALSSHALATDGATTLVAFGDSTTAARRVSSNYSHLLQKGLPEKGLPVHVVNAGVGGHNTNQARARFGADVLDKMPDIVVIQFGINDAAVDVWKDPPASKPRVKLDTYSENLRFFVRSLKSQDAKVILMTPNPLRWTPKLRQLYGRPPYQPAETSGLNVILTRHAERVREVASSEGVTLLDVYAIFEQFGKESDQSVTDLLRDGMHPNERGHRLIADELITLLVPD